MIIGIVSSIVLVIVSILIHYEALRIVSALLPGPAWLGLHGRMLLVVLACFAAHTVEVWTFAGAYYLFADHFAFGSVAGEHEIGFVDLVYFSVVTYSTIGYGDLYPIGGTRLLAGVEAVTGLLLIGWSASFTYLVMERFWPLHPLRRRRHPGKGEAPATPQRLWHRQSD
ncbi:MAG: potassium channel family protein [Pseudomonadota bacterium]